MEREGRTHLGKASSINYQRWSPKLVELESYHGLLNGPLSGRVVRR